MATWRKMIYKALFKRFFDIFFALFGMIVFLIVFVFFAPIIYFTDKGPIFYKSQRVGMDGKVFNMLKFRSMFVNAPDIRNGDGSTYNSADDYRVTKIGKFMRKTSLDETPQMINVLIGDMSIIGPRPATPMILDGITDLQKRRFEVRPGITGYTQMMYRNSAQGRQRYLADEYYVDHICFGIDMKIFFLTAINVLKWKNIYNTNNEKEKNDMEEKIK